MFSLSLSPSHIFGIFEHSWHLTPSSTAVFDIYAEIHFNFSARVRRETKDDLEDLLSAIAIQRASVVGGTTGIHERARRRRREGDA